MKTPARLALLDRILSAALAAAIAAAGLFWSAGARADDIDIYSLRNTEGFRPNVVIILDNSANWSANISVPACDATGANVGSKEQGKKMGVEKCALYKLISSLSVGDLSQFNFALMLFNESPYDSAYPRKAFVNVTTAAQKAALLNLISGLDIGADKSNNASTAESFYEAYQWFAGGAVHLGNKTTTKHDTAAFTDSTKTRYRSPGVRLRQEPPHLHRQRQTAGQRRDRIRAAAEPESERGTNHHPSRRRRQQ